MREHLLQFVNDARKRTLELVSDLADEQLIVPKTEIVNPFRWELGHVAFFYDVFLLRELGSDLAWITYRNFFQPYRRDVIAGFRTCAS